jgi:hypothetical protein
MESAAGDFAPSPFHPAIRLPLAAERDQSRDPGSGVGAPPTPRAGLKYDKKILIILYNCYKKILIDFGMYNKVFLIVW